MTSSIFDLRPDRWTESAACVGKDPELWFPVGRGGCMGDPLREDAAKAICNGVKVGGVQVVQPCPVRVRCLSDALEEEGGIDAARHGIRGGLNQFERAALVEGAA